MLDLYATMFGMKHVLKTLVGNQFVRGVSGGESEFYRQDHQAL